jgi:hypothetical protein
MPIVRLSELNCNQDKELPHTELRRLRRRPQRPQLLAVITDLRQGSSTKKIEDSRRIIEKSRRIISATEFSLTQDSPSRERLLAVAQERTSAVCSAKACATRSGFARNRP